MIKQLLSDIFLDMYCQPARKSYDKKKTVVKQ